MRVLSAQDIQAVSGGATTSASNSGLSLSTVFTVFLVGLYLLVTGKSLTDLI